MNPRFTKTALLILLILLAGPALADDVAAQGSRFDSQAFQERKARIESDFAQGDRYSAISEFDRRQVLEALDRIAAALDGVQDVEELTPQERADLFTDQELVNTVLTDAREHSRVVCKREGTVGTRFKSTRCKTVAEWDAIRENSQRAVRKKAAPNILRPGGEP